MIDSVESIADRIMILKEGKILGNDTISNLKQQFSQEEGTSLEDLFLDLTKDA
jgi:ABC-type multidrug transport system ATPase subunit